MAEFNKPALFGGNEFDAFGGGEDPAAVLRAAHESARKLLTRARDADDPAVVDRLVSYTDEHGSTRSPSSGLAPRPTAFRAPSGASTWCGC